MPTSIPQETIPTLDSDAHSTGPAPADGSAGVVLINASIFIGRTPTVYAQAGFRFAGIPVPNGANIISATVGVLAFNLSLTPIVTWRVVAEDVDDAAAWHDTHRPGTGGIPGRGPETTAGVDWDITAPWISGRLYNTPDLKDVVQELVDRPGWATGQDMAFIIRNRGATMGFRVVNALDNGFPARLNITYGPISGQIMRIVIN